MHEIEEIKKAVRKSVVVSILFFFQAEDGIRDIGVTGVQTCALPIYSYSTFALPEFEKDEGLTLLCRAHAYEDLVIELLNYDEEMIASGLPLRKGVVEVIANDPVTHDLRHLAVRLVEPEEIKFFPGQYMDFQVPGTEETRSFSMANTPGRDGVFEFVIKVYPDGQIGRAHV